MTLSLIGVAIVIAVLTLWAVAIIYILGTNRNE